MGWKKFAETDRGAVGEVECENHVEGFFFSLISRVLCIMNFYVGGKQ
jgi:hypothetical protein